MTSTTLRPSARDARAGGETILLVEDEDYVRPMLRQYLERQGYRVLDAADGARALELLAAEDAAPDVLVTDLVLPGIDGRAVAEAVTAARPGTKVIYMSGHAQRAVLEGLDVLRKPFALSELGAQIRRLLGP